MYGENIQFTKNEIIILKYVFKHYKDKYNARQLARLLSLNHAHVNKLCISLYEKKLFLKEDIGNSRYYQFNYNGQTFDFMKYILSLESFPKWLSVTMHELSNLKGHIKMGIIFGSSIKTKDYNDVDVLIIYDKSKEKDINKIKKAIRDRGLIEKPLRYIDMTEKDITKNKGDDVFYSIISESVVFYNSEKYVEVIKCLR